MKRFFLLAVLSALAGCTPARTPQPKGDAAKLAAKTVALVRADDEGGSRAYCSGVWLDDRHILTAAHCVRSNPLAKLFGEDDSVRYVVRSDVFPDGLHEAKFAETHEALRLAVDVELDLALLLAPDAHEHESASLSSKPIGAGDFAQTMGHPKGLWWSYSTGEVSAVREIAGPGDRAQWWVQTTAPISPGNSGCGLFNADGDLIGVASWKPLGRGVEGLSFFVHRDTIAAFVKGAS